MGFAQYDFFDKTETAVHETFEKTCLNLKNISILHMLLKINLKQAYIVDSQSQFQYPAAPYKSQWM